VCVDEKSLYQAKFYHEQCNRKAAASDGSRIHNSMAKFINIIGLFPSSQTIDKNTVNQLKKESNHNSET